MSLADTYEKIKPAIVGITLLEERGDKINFRIFGTGFCVDPSGIIVTARHIIRDYYKKILKAPLPLFHFEARMPPPKPGFSVVFFGKGSDRYWAIYPEPPETIMRFILPFEGDHPEDDVAVLRIPPCPKSLGNGYPSIEMGDLSYIREGDEIAIAGYPGRYDLTESRLPDLNRGTISRIDEKISDDKKWEITKLVLDITANRGNSGGPVFEIDSGNVLGLVSAVRLGEPPKIPDKLRGIFKIPTGMVYCIPSRIINEAISRLKSAEKRQQLTSYNPP